MNKTILILDSSLTTQKQFTKRLPASLYNLNFLSDAKQFISKAFELAPDAILMNSDFKNPSSYELVKLLRSIKCFEDIPIGMYSNITTPLEDEQSKLAGANRFVHMEEATLDQNVGELIQIFDDGSVNKAEVAIARNDFDINNLFLQSIKVWDKETTKATILKEIFKLQEYCSDINEAVKGYLILIAQICEVPIVNMYIIENDGPHAYTIHTPDFKEEEISDFNKTCLADFNAVSPGVIETSLSPKEIDYDCENLDLAQFYSQNMESSTYEAVQLKNQNEKPFATLHVISENPLSRDKIELFQYAADQAGLLFQNCIEFKRKMLYERKSRKAFSRFVPEKIIDDLIAESASTKKASVGEKRPVAIMFCYIYRFNDICDINKPEVLVNFLNRYFTTMCNIIKKHGGTIDKFIGNVTMALFGAPISHDDNVCRAIAAGYEMREALKTIEEELVKDLVMPEGLKFNIGIGIHYGSVIVGSIGSKDKTDYTVIGDNVNLASRIEGLTKNYGCQLMVSESVREQYSKEKEARAMEVKDTNALKAKIDELLKSETESDNLTELEVELRRIEAIQTHHDSDKTFVFRHLDDVKVKGKKIAVPTYAVDRSINEFSPAYRDSYNKGLELYQLGVFHLAKEYFEQALQNVEYDKAAELMLSRCIEFIANPPENWDGAIAFNTK